MTLLPAARLASTMARPRPRELPVTNHTCDIFPPIVQHRQCGCRLVSKQAAVASVVFVDVQTMLLDNLGCSSQCCCDGRIANVWQRLDENLLDFFQCEAVVEPGPHVNGEFMGLTHGNHDGHRNQAAGASVQTGTSPDICKGLVKRVGSDRGTEGV